MQVDNPNFTFVKKDYISVFVSIRTVPSLLEILDSGMTDGERGNCP